MPTTYEAEAGDFGLALRGDLMLTQHSRTNQESHYLALVEALRSADAAFTNLERAVGRWDEGRPSIVTGTP